MLSSDIHYAMVPARIQTHNL